MAMPNKTQMNVNVDNDLKQAAQKALKDLPRPMSLSAFVENCLKILVNGGGKK